MKYLSNIYRCFFLCLILVLPLGSQSQTLDLDLSTCRTMALEQSNQLEIATYQYQKTQFDSKAVKAKFLPNVSAIGLFYTQSSEVELLSFEELIPNTLPSSLAEKFPRLINENTLPRIEEVLENLSDLKLNLTLYNVFYAGVQLEQPLYMGGKIRAGYEMSKIGEDIARMNMTYNKGLVIEEVDKAYWEYVKVKEKVELAKKYEKTLATVIQDLKNAVETGMMLNNDLLKATVQLNDAKLQHQKADNGLELTRMNLCRLIGTSLLAKINIQDSLSSSPSFDPQEIVSNLMDRSDFNILSRETDLKERNIKLAKSDFLPQLGISGGYNVMGGIGINDEAITDGSIFGMAFVKIPIFGWGEGRNKVKSAEMEYAMAKSDFEEKMQLMQLEITQNRFKVTESVTKVSLTESSLQQANSNLKLNKDQYEVGMITLTPYLEAQTQWQEAYSNWVDAKAELKVSETEFLKSIGQLVQSVSTSN